MKKNFLIICLFLLFQVSAFAGAPTCTSFSFTASTVGSSLIQLQCSDPDGDPLTFAIASGPSHGTTSGLNPTTGFFIYTPTGGYTGSDSLTFNVTANSETSSNATLSLTVTNAKTRIIDTLLNPDGSVRQGKVTFILTQKVNSPAGVIPVSSSVSSTLNGSGQFDVSVYPSSALSPQAFYQVWFESTTNRRELLGVYNIPATNSTITLAAHQVTNTNLAAQYVFLSAAAINSILNGGSGAGVSSFEGRTGTVTSASGDYTASEVTNVAAGNIAATNVQAAINELDSEKVQTGSVAVLTRVDTSAGTTAAPGNTPTGSTRFTLYDGSGVTNGEYMASGVESSAWWLNNLASGKFNFYFGAVKKFDFSASAFTPTTDNAFDFGGSSNRVRHIYLSGGIILGSDATGDTYYRSSGGVLTRLAIGSDGQCLTVSSGLPAWGSCAGGGSGISSLNGLTGSTQTFANDTNVTISSSGTTHSIVWSGTLAKSRTLSTTVYTDQDNTYSTTNSQNFTSGSRFTLRDSTDTTKIARFSNANISTGQTRTFTFPDESGTLVLEDTTQTLTNKTLTSSTNVLGGVTLTLGSDATADMYYRNASGVLTRLGIGSNGQCLTVSSGLPVWGSCGGGGGGATTALDNLASVSINTSLISDTDNTDDLGSSSIRWKEVHAVKSLASSFQSPGTITLNAQGANTLFSGDLAGGSYSTLMSFQGGVMTLQGKIQVKSGYGTLSGNSRLETKAASDSEIAFIADSAASPTVPIASFLNNGTTGFAFYGDYWLVQKESSANPTSTQLSAGDHFSIYRKADKLIIAYNNGGTITYLSIPLDGSTTTWTQSTSAP